MRIIALLLCMGFIAGCGTMTRNEPGVFQPNKLEKVNTHVSKMVARTEAVKLSKGIPLAPRSSVKSSTIAPPSQPASQDSTMDVPRGLTMIPSSRLPVDEPQEATESFLQRAIRYSIVWAFILGFGYFVHVSAKKFKLPNENPFKKAEKPKEEQLRLKL